MVEKFARIQAKLAEAKASGNTRALKMWRTKLNKWQAEYGAYKPFGYVGKITEL